MPIVQQGSINTTALTVPGAYIQVLAPQIAELNGVPTNILGVVGTASWGPVAAPTTFGNLTQYGALFGPVNTNKYDMGTQVATASQQGANNFVGVRVTDGTDAAATGTLTASSAGDATAIAAAINSGQSGLRGPSNFVVATASTVTVTITAKYTGTVGNGLLASIGNGSKASTSRVTISLPGQVPEVFDNLGAANPTAASVTLSGGLDGSSSVAATDLVGSDTGNRSGMYALRGKGASVGILADCDDTTTWPDQVAFGLFEGIEMMLVGPAGQTISTAISAKSSAAVDDYSFKVLMGDWIYWLDTTSGQTRLVSPQGFAGGRIINLSPEQSPLNKPIYGIVATQKSAANQTYSGADITALVEAGIDVIAHPSPGGNYYGLQTGNNGSSNALRQADPYTRMTNYIASTLNAGMGVYVGLLQSVTERADAKATLEHFLSRMYAAGMIGDVNNPGEQNAYQVILDASNNPASSVALGYQIATVKVHYLSVVRFFLINLDASGNVQITSQAA